MKIRIISDLHIDVNPGYPFKLKYKKTFTIICGDRGYVKYKENTGFKEDFIVEI